MTQTPDRATLARHLAALKAAYLRLAPRERLGLVLAAWVLGLGLLWMLGIAPALHTLGQAPKEHARLNAQLTQMQSMAQTAKALRAQAPTGAVDRTQTLFALDQASAALAGTGQIAVLGERVNVTLTHTPAQVLAQWLSQVRINARLTPLEAKLQRSSAAPATWSGTLVLGGPGLSND